MAAPPGGRLLDRDLPIVADGSGAPSQAPPVLPRDPDLSEEAALCEGGFLCVAGVDEAGRGAWAGPLVAAAVILPEPATLVGEALAGIRDSKLLSVEQRAALFETVLRVARAVAIGWVAADEVDLIGLTAANELAMVRAARALDPAPDFLLVDAFKLRSVDIPQRGIVKGDRRCLSIASASIVAKVFRDVWLGALAGRFPGYGFEGHVGYGVPLHREAITEHGALPIHRLSYAPLRPAEAP